jgi:hypothetical protein
MPGKVAIQQDADKKGDDDTLTIPAEQMQANARIDRMDEIADRRKQQMIDDGGVPPDAFDNPTDDEDKIKDDLPSEDDLPKDDEPHPAPEDDPTPKAEDDPKEPEPVPDDGPTLATEDLATSRVKVKIDGQEEELTVSQLVRGFQKDSAASKRLQEASDRAKELDERERALSEREQALTAKPEPEPQPDPQPDQPSFNRDVGKDLVDAIYKGEDDKALDALEKLQVTGRPVEQPTPQVDVAALKQEVQTDLRNELKVEEALKTFQSDFSDIVSDPVLAGVADSFLNDELQSESDLSVALTNAGQRTREWINQKAPQPEEKTPTPSPEKSARKQQIDNLPAAGGSKEPVKEPPKRQTTADVIAEMKAKRHSPY